MPWKGLQALLASKELEGSQFEVYSAYCKEDSAHSAEVWQQLFLIDRRAENEEILFFNLTETLSMFYIPTASFSRMTSSCDQPKQTFEVVINSLGFGKIGIVADCVSPNQEGQGIGDDLSSYVYDPISGRMWQGHMQTQFGEPCNPGDCIKCELDIKKGELSFYKNDEFMGVAARNIPTTSIEYSPAFSCSSYQRLGFRKGTQTSINLYEKLAELRDYTGRAYPRISQLHFLAFFGKTTSDSDLIEREVSATTGVGHSPLLWAAAVHNHSMVELLLRKTSCENMKKVDKLGYTLAPVAAIVGSWRLMRKLLRDYYDDDLFAPTSSGLTALHLCCQYGNYATLLELLKHPVASKSINEQCYHCSQSLGYSPLHLAAANGHYYVCVALIDNGADPTLRSKNNRLALDEAVEHGSIDCALLLTKYATKVEKENAAVLAQCCKYPLLASILNPSLQLPVTCQPLVAYCTEKGTGGAVLYVELFSRTMDELRVNIAQQLRLGPVGRVGLIYTEDNKLVDDYTLLSSNDEVIFHYHLCNPRANFKIGAPMSRELLVEKQAQRAQHERLADRLADAIIVPVPAARTLYYSSNPDTLKPMEAGQGEIISKQQVVWQDAYNINQTSETLSSPKVFHLELWSLTDGLMLAEKNDPQYEVFLVPRNGLFLVDLETPAEILYFNEGGPTAFWFPNITISCNPNDAEQSFDVVVKNQQYCRIGIIEMLLETPASDIVDMEVYSIDPLNGRFWNSEDVQSQFGEPCVAGDCIRFVVNMQARELSVWKNDQFMGVAARNISISPKTFYTPVFMCERFQCLGFRKRSGASINLYEKLDEVRGLEAVHRERVDAGVSKLHYLAFFGKTVPENDLKGHPVEAVTTANATPLMWACAMRNDAMVNLLSKNKHSVGILHDLVEAVATVGDWKVMQNLLNDSHFAVDTINLGLLEICCKLGHYATLVVLLKHLPKWKLSPNLLHLAASCGDYYICLLLLNSGADPKLRNRFEVTALHKAAERGSIDCALLLAKNATQQEKEEAARVACYRYPLLASMLSPSIQYPVNRPLIVYCVENTQSPALFVKIYSRTVEELRVKITQQLLLGAIRRIGYIFTKDGEHVNDYILQAAALSIVVTFHLCKPRASTDVLELSSLQELARQLAFNGDQKLAVSTLPDPLEDEAFRPLCTPQVSYYAQVIDVLSRSEEHLTGNIELTLKQEVVWQDAFAQQA